MMPRHFRKIQPGDKRGLYNLGVRAVEATHPGALHGPVKTREQFSDAEIQALIDRGIPGNRKTTLGPR